MTNFKGISVGHSYRTASSQSHARHALLALHHPASLPPTLIFLRAPYPQLVPHSLNLTTSPTSLHSLPPLIAPSSPPCSFSQKPPPGFGPHLQYLPFFSAPTPTSSHLLLSQIVLSWYPSIDLKPDPSSYRTTPLSSCSTRRARSFPRRLVSTCGSLSPPSCMRSSSVSRVC